MKLYKDANDKIYSITEIQKLLVKEDWIEITEDERDLIIAEKNNPTTDKEIYDNKWDQVNTYLLNEIPNITDQNGNEYIVSGDNIDKIRQKYFDWNDTDSYKWVQFGIDTFNTDKVELGIIMQKYNTLEQNKINEVFELGDN